MERVSPEQLADCVVAARRRWNIPGIAVAIVADGAVVSAADGVRDLDGDATVSADTVFRIASITKPFTATLAMTLVQDGLLALDEPPPGTQTTATVRQLLSHVGGLAIEWPVDLDDANDDEALLRLAAREPEFLPVGPGELFSYCNTGYWLVGAAAARAAGTTFEAAMHARVLDPLGLEATAFETGGAARGHDQVEPGSDEHEAAGGTYPRVRRPSGGLWSTVGDLLRFGEHHLGGPGPLTPESIAELRRPLVPLPGGAYGLGWFLLDGRPSRTVEHPGSAAGFQSSLMLVPEERIAFAALTNSSRGMAAIRDVLEQIGLGRRPPPTAQLRQDALDRFAGRYEGQGIRINISRADGQLALRYAEVNPFTNEELVFPPMTARPVGEREFEVTTGEWKGDRFDFPRDGLVRTYVLAQRVQ